MNVDELIKLVRESPSDEILLEALCGVSLTSELVNSFSTGKGLDGKFAPIHWTLYRNFTKSSRYLIEKGTDINLEVKNKRNEAWTPLFYAVLNNNLEMVEYLLEKGANAKHVVMLHHHPNTIFDNILSVLFTFKEHTVMEQVEGLFSPLEGQDHTRKIEEFTGELNEEHILETIKNIHEAHLIRVKILKLLLNVERIDVDSWKRGNFVIFKATPYYNPSHIVFYPPRSEKAQTQLKPLRDEVYKNDIELFTMMIHTGLVPKNFGDGFTELMSFTESRNLELIKLYILTGQDPNTETIHGRKAEWYASECDDKETCQYLQTFDKSLKFEARRSMFLNGIDISMINEYVKDF